MLLKKAGKVERRGRAAGCPHSTGVLTEKLPPETASDDIGGLSNAGSLTSGAYTTTGATIDARCHQIPTASSWDSAIWNPLENNGVLLSQKQLMLDLSESFVSASPYGHADE